MSRLPKSFFNRDPATVARELLGKILVHTIDGHILSGRIIETEAYLASLDEAAHSFKGKRKGNHSLYLDAGHAYVHTMRHHTLLDVVTEGVDVPSAVLIRALEPLEGTETMQKFRNTASLKNLTEGPGNLCRALGITKMLDGIDMTSPHSPLSIEESAAEAPLLIEASPRIGISKGKEALLRFRRQGNTRLR